MIQTFPRRSPGEGRRYAGPRYLAAALLFATASLPAIAAEDTCPYLHEYRKLRATLPKLPAARAAAALDRYAASHDNPEACEETDIDRRLTTLEAPWFTVVDGKRRIAANTVFRCNQFDPASGRCAGPMEDGTAQPRGRQPIRRTRFSNQPLLLVSSHKDARLIGVYVTTLGNLLDGKPPLARSTASSVSVSTTTQGGGVLMAIYETQGTWRYRKAVWYF